MLLDNKNRGSEPSEKTIFICKPAPPQHLAQSKKICLHSQKMPADFKSKAYDRTVPLSASMSLVIWVYQPGGQVSFLFPSMWKWRCFTVWKASSPLLLTTL